jgi:hypothetical protein
LVELKGRFVRVQAMVEDDYVAVEVAAEWDAIYRHALVLVVKKDSLRELEEAAGEVRDLVLKALAELEKGGCGALREPGEA